MFLKISKGFWVFCSVFCFHVMPVGISAWCSESLQSLSVFAQDDQTQTFTPLCLILVQAQAYESNSIGKKILYNRQPKNWLLIIDSYVIFGVYFVWKTTVAVRISSNDTNTTLHNSTTFFKMLDAPYLNVEFPFLFGQIYFCTVRTWR